MNDKEIDLLWAEIRRLREKIDSSWNLTYTQFGTWTSWTPTVTQGVAVTSVPITARYAKIGSTVAIQARIYISTAGTAGQPIVISGIPSGIQPAVTPAVIGTAMVLRIGVAWYQGALYAEGANTLKIQTDGQLSALGITPSFALALYHQIWVNGVFER